MEEGPYEEMRNGLLTQLRKMNRTVAWEMETWGIYNGRRGFVDSDPPLFVSWEIPKGTGVSRGNLYFNSALLTETTPQWLAAALVDMVNKDSPNAPILEEGDDSEKVN